MEHWIQTVAEPKRLILAWQAPDQFGPQNRTRWAVGIVERDAEDATFRYLTPVEFETLNPGKSLSLLTSFGYRGYPTFRLTERGQVYRSGVLAAFMRRLPPRSRPDFQAYLKAYRIASASLSDFALLGITEAKLPSDGFSLVDPLDPELRHCDLLLEVAGFRHNAGALHHYPVAGDTVVIEEDPEKTYDRNAVAVFVQGEKIGNVNRLQAPTFMAWLSRRKVTAVVERMNGTVDKPRAHIFIQVRPLSDVVETANSSRGDTPLARTVQFY